MLLNLDNEIDKKVSQIYPEHVISDMKKETMEYFGINITEDPQEDLKLKIYFEKFPSLNLYKESPKKDAIIDCLLYENMVGSLEAVYDEDNFQFSRYDIKLKNRYKNNMLEFFKLLGNNTKIFGKYKDEILNLTRSIKYSTNPNDEYASLFFFGVKKAGLDIKTLKFYWIKHPEFAQQYLETLNASGIPQIQELIPIAINVEKNCGGNILMTGIDYNENNPRKHKMYIEYPTNLYDGLVKTFSDNQELVNRINLVRDWNEIHPEFFCDGFNIGKNAKNKLIVSFYFMFKKDK